MESQLPSSAKYRIVTKGHPREDAGARQRGLSCVFMLTGCKPHKE